MFATKGTERRTTELSREKKGGTTTKKLGVLRRQKGRGKKFNVGK